jgi:hypothetical protein
VIPRAQGRWRLVRVVAHWAVILVSVDAGAAEYSLLFGHDLNVWSWDQSAGWDDVLGEKLFVLADGRHSRRLSKASDFNRRSSTTNAELRLRYPLTSLLGVGSFVSFEQSRLRSGGVVSDVIGSRAVLSSEYEVYPGVNVDGTFGTAHDERRGRSNTGAAWSIGSTAYPLRHLSVGETAHLAASFNHTAVESPQGDAETALGFNGRMNWTPTIQQTFMYNEDRSELRYVSRNPGGDILSRSNHVRHIRSAIHGSLRGIGNVELNADVRWGEVEDDASDDSTSLKHRTDNTTRSISSDVTWHLPIGKPELTYRLGIGNKRRTADPVAIDDSTFRNNDLDRRQNDLSMSLGSALALGSADSLTLSGTMAISRDHTPAITEVNDRDDFTRVLVAGYQHLFDRGTSLQLSIERIETHEVWLHSRRSANNKWNRSLNLWATTKSDFGVLSIRQRAFFKAQLEEFDFDYLTPESPRSRNARIGRLDFDGELPWPGEGVVGVVYTVEARTRGVLIPADRPGQRPTLWRLTRNEFAQILTARLSAPIGPRWTMEPKVSVSRQLDFTPTSATWNPTDLGVEIDRQEALYLEAVCLYRPHDRGGLFSVRAARTYSKRGSYNDTRSSVSMTYQHTF